MKSWSEALAKIEGKLTSALSEIQELRREVWALEEENQNLRDQLYSDFHRPVIGQGVASLQALYDEGYHICPAYFAKPLTADMGCLLCLALLSNASQESKG